MTAVRDGPTPFLPAWCFVESGSSQDESLDNTVPKGYFSKGLITLITSPFNWKFRYSLIAVTM